MTFTREDYIQAITRIFDKNNHAIGTGFLVAPGYILTCAHVVLQAIGIDKKNFALYEGVPTDLIALDFPVLANGQKIDAKVVAWLPYSLSQGDVAGLKLLADEPSGAKSIPLTQIKFSDIKDEEHSVYGFGSVEGGQSDAYKPKTIIAGERFQFYKAGNPNDETIKEGFSGAPVWNEQRNCVIGMIATAMVSKEEQRSKAYAIPKKELDKGSNGILKQLRVYSLCDLIEKHLQQLGNEQKQKLRKAIATAFYLCDSGSVWIEKKTLQLQLLGLSQLGNRGWDGVDRLRQFAVFLATMDAVPGSMYRQIKNWVEYSRFNFDSLQTLAISEKKERNVSPAYPWEHLVVEVKPDEQEQKNVYISMWAIGDPDTYDSREPPPPLLETKKLLFTELPSFIDQWIDEEESLDNPMVHFFVPRYWLALNLDSYKTKSGLTLGSQYKLVMRIDLSQSPTLGKYYKWWQEKWQKILREKVQSLAGATFVRADITQKKQLLELKYAEMAILENLTEAQVEEVFTFITKKTALPVALWLRRSELSDRVDHVLDTKVVELPQRILKERLNALEEEENHCLGHHLSLVWEDPNIVTPTMNLQFDQEVC
ncbi:MAG: trypsin-like peptidase domain-containing protein [Symploca sp. SIO1C4]|uniref:Trypsin-like peptidase domain-containing protein n=1 Tax=Symploca sp. SIO1C4 TaxID=2607765 RepID=A0A6B3N652_9CYAN|nr:trypsin-like peptidase domain-containing protein [Symploca sp. SIO1C4]